MTTLTTVSFSGHTLSEVVREVCARLPRRTCGLFISSKESGPAEEFLIFDSNLRNEREWRDVFRSYGGHHLSHDDVGFMIDPREVVSTHLRLRREGRYAVGLFHTHRLLGPEFTQIDLDMHVDETLWHLVLSVADPRHPEFRAYCIRSRSAYPAGIQVI